MADARGLKSLTMRNLGHVLDVEAMSLYNHIEDKNDILDGIVDLVLSEIELRPASENWKLAMREMAISAHETLKRHPWSCELVLSPKPPRMIQARTRYIEAILACFRVAGFSPAAASRGYHAIDSHVLGFTLWALGHSMSDDVSSEFLETFVRQFDFVTYPYLGEHVRQHLVESDVEEIGEFEFGLDLILDGLERLKETA